MRWKDNQFGTLFNAYIIIYGNPVQSSHPRLYRLGFSTSSLDAGHVFVLECDPHPETCDAMRACNMDMDPCFLFVVPIEIYWNLPTFTSTFSTADAQSTLPKFVFCVCAYSQFVDVRYRNISGTPTPAVLHWDAQRCSAATCSLQLAACIIVMQSCIFPLFVGHAFT